MSVEPDSISHLVRPHPHGCVVTVTVVPGASRTAILGVHGDTLRVRVTAPPERGQANAAVCKAMAGEFGCRAELLTGATSRRKRVLLRGMTVGAAVATIASHGG